MLGAELGRKKEILPAFHFAEELLGIIQRLGIFEQTIMNYHLMFLGLNWTLVKS